MKAVEGWIKSQPITYRWTKVKTKVTDAETLKKALARMGCKNVQTGTKQITQYGTTETANLWVDDGVGFKLEKDGTYSMIGDFYHTRSELRKYYSRNKEFEADFNTAYAIEDVKQKVDELGFVIEENDEAKVGSDGLIRMVAVKFF